MDVLYSSYIEVKNYHINPKNYLIINQLNVMKNYE